MHVVSVLLSEIAGPNSSKASTKTSIIHFNSFGDRDTMHASSACNIPHKHAAHIPVPFHGQPLRAALEDGQGLRVCPRPRWICLTKVRRGVPQRRRRLIAAGKARNLDKALVSHRTTPSRHAPSSLRTQALIPLWNWRITSVICGGTSKRARKCLRSLRGRSRRLSVGACNTGTVVRALTFPNIIAFFFFFFFSLISLIADGPHHYHPACGH